MNNESDRFILTSVKIITNKHISSMPGAFDPNVKLIKNFVKSTISELNKKLFYYSIVKKCVIDNISMFLDTNPYYYKVKKTNFSYLIHRIFWSHRSHQQINS